MSHIEKTVGSDGKMLHACKLCGKTSKYSTHLINHVEGNHLSGMIKYSCSFCGDVLKTKMSLDNHVRTKHN